MRSLYVPTVALLLAVLMPGAAGAADRMIAARDNFFAPADTSATQGDTVTWTNQGRVSHTVTADSAADGSFDVTLSPGQSFTLPLSDSGSVDYHCRLHGSPGAGMHGSLQVESAAGRTADRLAGTGRIETAIAISRYQFPDPAAVDEVYLSAATVNPDALVGGTLTRGPILLVPSCGELPTAVAQEIRRLDPVRVVALGGVNTICQEMLDQAVNA